MREFDPFGLFMIAYEAFGVWTWLALAAAVLALLAYMLALILRRRFGGLPAKLAFVAGLAAAAAFGALAPPVTQAPIAGFTDIRDWLTLAFGAAGAGLAVFLALLPLFALMRGGAAGRPG